MTQIKPRHPRGMEEISEQTWRERISLIRQISEVCEAYGFAPLETGLLEFAEAIGAYLPDTDRPNAGVFALQDGADWLALRYDLTAPLARYVAENYDALPKPFRRYQWGWVLRNEKPAEGRFRQLMQIDADTIGAADGIAGAAADAEMCMIMADCMEQAGIPRNQYCVRVNSRKILEAALAKIGIDINDDDKKAHIMRGMDKYDRLGPDGVRALLGKGRHDPSGDWTKGAELSPAQIDAMIALLEIGGGRGGGGGGGAKNNIARAQICDEAEKMIGNQQAAQGFAELRQMDELFTAAGYGENRIMFDTSIVRGLGYYTGPVFEIAAGNLGSLGGGGRYDNLLQRFRAPVPATGMSIGLSRLHAFLQSQKKQADTLAGPIVVLVMDKNRIADYQNMAAALREAGLRAEIYLGSGGMRAQLKYADKRRAPLAIIQGEDEYARGEITIKDLALGAARAADMTDNLAWRSGQHAQITIKADQLAAACRAQINKQSAQK